MNTNTATPFNISVAQYTKPNDTGLAQMAFLPLREIEAQITSLLGRIILIDDLDGSKDTAQCFEYLHTDDSNYAWPNGEPIVSVANGTNEGVRIDIASYHCDNYQNKPQPVFSIKYFLTPEVVWRIGMLLDKAFQEGMFHLENQTEHKEPFCELDSDGNIHYLTGQ